MLKLSFKVHEKLKGKAMTAVNLGEWEEVHAFAAEMAEVKGDPLMMEEVMKQPDWPMWKQVQLDELKNHKVVHTWDLVDPINVIGSKWVFKTPCNANRNIVKYKACLITQGFSQVSGINFLTCLPP